MKWFGVSWGAQVCDPAEHVPTPAGATCNGWCQEPIDPDDQGVIMPGITLDADGQTQTELVYYHLNCHLRQIVGSVGHQLGKCVCFTETGGPAAFHDPPGLSPREAADEAVEVFYRLNP